MARNPQFFKMSEGPETCRGWFRQDLFQLGGAQGSGALNLPSFGSQYGTISMYSISYRMEHIWYFRIEYFFPRSTHGLGSSYLPSDMKKAGPKYQRSETFQKSGALMSNPNSRALIIRTPAVRIPKVSKQPSVSSRAFPTTLSDV